MTKQDIELSFKHVKSSGSNVANESKNDKSIAVAETTISKDEAVLAGFGKKQQLKRRFKYVSSIGLTCTLMLSWLAVLNALQLGLLNGGPAGLIWGFIGAFVGAMLQALVMAEISSMIPLAGGAFNWVAILSPPRYRRFFSYIAGWFTVITYQIFVIYVAYSSASVLQGLIILTVPDYAPQLWHATLVSYAVALFGFLMNTYLGRLLPQIESFQLVLFVAAYLGILITLVRVCPPRAASDVFGTFMNINGWENDGISFLVGWLVSVGAYIGVDGADHIGKSSNQVFVQHPLTSVAEEIQSSAKVIPFAMLFSTAFNGILAFSLLIAVMFVSQDYTAAAQSDTGYAFIEIFQTGLGSTNGAAVLVAITVVINILSISSVIATASRSLWAFARENGAPFSSFLVKIDPNTRLPFNAICVTIGVEMVIALISVGSSTAYGAFYSVQLAVYYTTFLIAALVMLHKRLTTPASELPWGPFRLGRWGTPITVAAILYTIVTLVFSFFPTALPVTPQNMNYSVLIYGAAIILMLAFWFLHGRHAYVGPIWELEHEYTRKQ